MGKSQTVTVPIRVVNEANSRSHWRTKAKRAKDQRQATRISLALKRWRPEFKASVLVTLTRIAARTMDDDGLSRSLKAVRDEVARWLGYDDAPTSPIQWRYDQRKGEPKEYAVEITITADPEACPTCGRI